MRGFELFVIPFMLGLSFIVGYMVIAYIRWIARLSMRDRVKIRKNFWRTLPRSLKEVFMECLLHRKIYKVNPLLGYMHMSLAFGWFLLILVGNIQTHLYSRYILNPPYYPIFYKFFEPYPLPFFSYRIFEFLMDFLLLITISGVILAYIKRVRSQLMGLRRTTSHAPADRFALTALWLIFPFRLLAESFTSHHRGEFLTGTLYRFLSEYLPVNQLAYPLWWCYSITLGVFFFAMPFSRYMHIVTEPLLIFLRNCGIKTEKEFITFSDIELNACSRCGICIDACQMASAAEIRNVQAVYFLREARYKTLKRELANHCLMCGRCNEACPVGIDAVAMRMIKRKDFSHKTVEYKYIKEQKTEPAKTLYFAGCMTHMTPTIKNSMMKIFSAAKENVTFMDKDESICCGRPLMLSGNMDSALNLIKKNKRIIEDSGAKTLITSCPICYRTFVEDYRLEGIEVLHHTQYLDKLIKEKRIHLNEQQLKTVYHDPCEIGRGLQVYQEPRNVLSSFTNLLENKYSKNNALCCGGCVGNSQISSERREMIARDAVLKMTIAEPDYLVTSCPLCKKTFNRFAENAVDISQLVAQALV